MTAQSDDTTSSSPLGVGDWNGTYEAEGKRPLKIVIVGAGIGGLAAAIGLRRARPNVSLMCYQLLLTYAYLIFLAIQAISIFIRSRCSNSPCSQC